MGRNWLEALILFFIEKGIRDVCLVAWIALQFCYKRKAPAQEEKPIYKHISYNERIVYMSYLDKHHY